VCGSGFISHVDPGSGEETCLDINECLTIDAAQLDSNCTCERCACKNVFGSYQCARRPSPEQRRATLLSQRVVMRLASAC